MRWIMVALLAGVTACSTTIAGHGSSPATNPKVVRAAAQTPVGDPVTADLCAGIPPAALSRWGQPVVHWYQDTGRCYYDVYVDDSTALQIDTSQLPKSDFHSPLAGRPGHGGVLNVWVYATDSNGGCRRAFQVGRFVFDLYAFSLQGTVEPHTLCAAGTAAAHAEMRAFAAPSSTVPRRPVPGDTLTRFDLCRVMSAARLGRVGGLAELSAPEPIDAGGGCRADGLSTQVEVEVALIDTRFAPSFGQAVTLRGHQLEEDVDAAGAGCFVDAPRDFVSGSPVREYLTVTLSSDRLTGKRCSAVGEGIAANLLEAVGLR